MGIYGQLCKRLNIDYTPKRGMQKLKFSLENELPRIIKDFYIEMDVLILVRRQDFLFIYKEKTTTNCPLVDVTIPIDSGVKIKEIEKIYIISCS